MPSQPGALSLLYIDGAGPRTDITGSVPTANRDSSEQLIPFHHDLWR